MNVDIGGKSCDIVANSATSIVCKTPYPGHVHSVDNTGSSSGRPKHGHPDSIFDTAHNCLTCVRTTASFGANCRCKL